MTNLDKLTHEQKDAIIRKAVEVCKWIGWMRLQGVSYGVAQLKEEIEHFTGKEIEEYT